MEDDIKVDYGYMRLMRGVISPAIRVSNRVGDRVWSIFPRGGLEHTDTLCTPVLLLLQLLWLLFCFVPYVLVPVCLIILYLVLTIFYFMLTVYMDSIFLLFTVLIAYYQVPRKAFYGYLSSLIVGLFVTWLNCDATHYSKLTALVILHDLNLEPLIKLLDLFGKFRSCCPVDGLFRSAVEVMIFSRTPLLIRQIGSWSVLERDGPDDFYRYEGVFEIVRTSPKTATIMFRTKFNYFMQELDYDENKLGVVSRVFRLVFQDRTPMGRFFAEPDPEGDIAFHHMSPRAIIIK